MKPLFWMGSSRKAIREFPEEVKDEIGHALQEAQDGLKPLSAKPLQGYRGVTVLEVVEDFRTDTYRVVYTVRFEGAVLCFACLSKEVKTWNSDTTG